MKNVLIALGLMAVFAAPAFAGDYTLTTPADALSGQPSVTYFDLLRQVVPDLAADGPTWTGDLPKGIRHIDGLDAEGEIPDAVTINYIDTRRVQADGKTTIWVIADLGDGGNLGTYTLLAAFSDEPRPKLLDAAEVDTDQLTGFSGTPLRISAKDEAMLVDSEHSNSSQTYQSKELVFLKEGRFRLIDDLFAFGTRSCDFQQLEQISVSATPGGVGYWPITVIVTRSQVQAPKVDSGEEDADIPCLDPQPTDFTNKDFTAVYVWDDTVGAYGTSSRELNDLSAADSKLF